MQTLETLIREHPFFKSLSPQDIQFIAGCAANVHFDAGTYIFREGEEASYFYIIRHGKVALEAFADQRGPITVETIETGEALGWSWLFPPYRWHFSARAIVPVRAIAMDGVCLRNKCEKDHDLGYKLVMLASNIMMQRLQATRLQLLDVYSVGKRGG